jgi:two-component system, chemotaxis family, sensor kinase CheA
VDLARYAELFRTEAREHLAGIDEALTRLADGGGRADIDALFRATHTIKGMAGAMGYTSVESLSHAIESLLDFVRSGAATIARADLVALLFDATDALSTHVDDAVEGRPLGVVAPALLQRLEHESRPAPAPAPRDAAVEGATDATPRRTRETMRHARIDLKHLDALLDLTGELVIARDRLMRAADASGDRGVQAAAQDTAKLVSTLQEEVLQARMVPVGQVFDRFPRLVRDVARDLGKPVHFVMQGRDLALDRSMLDAIVDPVVHLLRNAIDHGFESAEARVAAGKPATGKLVLRAARERDALVLSVSDDGRGIDRDHVRARAIVERRLSSSVTALSDDDLVKLLAQPGFTTAAAVTALSGRGVGIDVVANRVRALGGALEVSSTLGVGTTFTLRLPMTLAIVRALLVEVGGRAYAVPAAHVVEALELDDTERHTEQGRDAIGWRSERLPLVRLRRVFGEPPSDDAGAQALVVESAGRRIACKVDALLGQQDIVVKPFDAVRGAVALFSGTTILGDGSPALIVDVGSLT